MSTRLYIVSTDDGEKHLVDATGPAQAIRHVSRGKFMATIAAPKDIVQLMTDGIRLEHARAEPEQPQ